MSAELLLLFAKWSLLNGYVAEAYNPPNPGVNADTLTDACVLLRDQWLPQAQLACAQAVGPRRECLFINGLAFAAAALHAIAPTAELWQPAQDAHFGTRCEKLMSFVSSYSYQRHSTVAKLTGLRTDVFGANLNVARHGP